MAKLPLSQTVHTSLAERSWRSSILSLLTSTLVQGLAVTALIVTPLLASQTLPPPASRLQLPDFVVPVTPPPPPPTSTGKKSSSDTKRAVHKPTLLVDDFVAPSQISDVILEEIAYGDDWGDDWGDDGGVPGGVDFGVPGAPQSTPLEPVTPEPSRPVEIGGDIRPPHKIVHVNPVYPRIAIEARVQGTVTLRAILDAQGNVADLRVIDSIPLLDGAAIEAVQQWKYEPTYLNGYAVPVVMSVEVEFVLR